MKLVLQRYVFKEVATPFALAMLAMVIIMLIQRMIQITEWVVNRGVPLLYVFQIIALMLPFFLTIVTPVALLLATLLAINRLSADSEITVMKATGISVARLFTPVLFLGLLSTVGTAFLSLYIIPRAADWSDTLMKNLTRTSARAAVRVKGFVQLGSRMTLYVDAMEDDTLKGVMLARMGSKKRKNVEGPETVIALAKEGRITSDPDKLVNYLKLEDGQIQTSDWDGKIFRYIKFDTLNVKIDLENADKKGGVERGTDFELMDISTLGRKKEEYAGRLKEIKAKGSKTKSDKMAADRYRVALRQIAISIHQKFSLPFACLILALWGIPLGIQPPRTTRNQGVVTGIMLTMVYYVLVSGGKILAVKGVIPTFWALWGPNLVVMLSGLYFLYRVSNDRPLPFAVATAWVAEKSAVIAGKFRRET